MTNKPPRKHPDEYEIGKGKPPKSGQFKKGQSGNPKGRPSNKWRNGGNVLKDALETQITIEENGVRMKRSKGELIYQQLVNKALSGNMRAMTLLLPLLKVVEPPAESPEAKAARDKTWQIMVDLMNAQTKAKKTLPPEEFQRLFGNVGKPKPKSK